MAKKAVVTTILHEGRHYVLDEQRPNVRAERLMSAAVSYGNMCLAREKTVRARASRTDNSAAGIGPGFDANSIENAIAVKPAEVEAALRELESAARAYATMRRAAAVKHFDREEAAFARKRASAPLTEWKAP